MVSADHNFPSFVQIYTNDAAVRSTLGRLALTAVCVCPPFGMAIGLRHLTPTDSETLCRPGWPLILPCGFPVLPRGCAQPPFPRFDSAERPSTAHRHRPPRAALRALPGLSIFGYCSRAVGKHLLLN